MPRLKGTGKGKSKVVTMRFPDEEDAYFRRKANENGLSLSAYLHKTLVNGAVAENIQDVEERIGLMLQRASESTNKVPATILPDALILSIYTCEALLVAITEARDPQALYDAQDRAKAKLLQEKLSHG